MTAHQSETQIHEVLESHPMETPNDAIGCPACGWGGLLKDTLDHFGLHQVINTVLYPG